LIELLKRQRALVGELAELARQQAGLTEAGRTEALLQLLGRRQEIIDRFAVAQEDLARLTGGLSERLRDLAEPQRRQIRSLIDEIGEALADVLQRDEQDQETLRASRDDVRRDIATVNTSKQAHRAYVQRNLADNRFADSKG
jgi:vacuolar-type H+-ATPase subunit I/STV1